MREIAFFDDYSFERGHHPDYLVGLAIAADGRFKGSLPEASTAASIYCPQSFLEGRPDAASLYHRAVCGELTSRLKSTGPGGEPVNSEETTRRNLEESYSDADRRGSDIFVNLFLDENWDSFPITRTALPIVHALHRPAELTGELGGVNAVKPGDAVRVLRMLGVTDRVVVHTRVGEAQARRWLPADRVRYLGWPAATEADISRRLASGTSPSGDSEPYVLLIGEALDYKGPRALLEALSPGPLLRIAGNLAPGPGQGLVRDYPRARVTWEPGWVTRSRMEELISGATVVAFAYQDGFHAHGGVSGALVQALTFGKPVVVTQTLAHLVPESESCLVVPNGDVVRLRKAIDDALCNSAALHEAARAMEPYLLAWHSYEGHVERLVEWLGSRPGQGRRVSW